MEKMHAPLKALQKEIKNTNAQDQIGKEKLDRLSGQIDKVLQDKGSVPGPHHQALQASLEDAILHFEVSHPALTSMMQSVINTFLSFGV